MGNKILLPAAIWQGFDPMAGDFAWDVADAGAVGNIKIKDFAFDAPVGESVVRVAMRGYIPEDKKGGNILVVEEYDAPPDMDFIAELCADGTAVFVPDISGVGSPATTFPEELAYGRFADAGEHLCKVMPTAKETCQYLYSVIVKRALAFLDAVLEVKNTILLGLGDAVEVAIQVVGSGSDVKALAAINGSGYREYIRLNKYGGGKELDITEERMCWLSGVASVAYAKNVNVPTFIALGTNSKKCDIDRLENLVALMPTKMISVSLSPETGEYISKESFVTLKNWISALYHGGIIPVTPVATLQIRDDGIPRVEVNTDTALNAERVKVYFSYGEYNHALRKWSAMDAFTVSKGNYICSPAQYDARGALFAFALVQYAGGMVIASNEVYMELAGQPVRKPSTSSTPILFAPSASNALQEFVEDCNSVVLFESDKRIVTVRSGAQGITTGERGIKTYNVGRANASASIIQVDICADSYCDVEFVLEVAMDDVVREYKALVSVAPTQGFFLSYRLEARDFKCQEVGYPPIGSWEGIKSLKITGCEALIGNILFI